MDKTITRRATLMPWLLHAGMRRNPLRLLLLPLTAVPAIGYAIGLVDRAGLKQWMQRILIGTVPADSLARLADSFAVATLAGNIRPGALTQIAADKAAGRTLVMATASYAFYAQAIGARLGFDHVIGTRAISDAQGRVTPVIDGENCYGAAKLAMVRAWEAASGFAGADVHRRFYSDHVSDAPMFEHANQAIAVNPHDALRTLATARGWQIVDW